MQLGKCLTGGLQSGHTVNLIGVQYNRGKFDYAVMVKYYCYAFFLLGEIENEVINHSVQMIKGKVKI